jgi:hypothetical protein
MSLALIRCEYLLLDFQEVACVESHVILNCLQRHSLQSLTELVALLWISSAVCVYMFAAGRFYTL